MLLSMNWRTAGDDDVGRMLRLCTYAKSGFRLLVRTNCFVRSPYFHALFMFDMSVKVKWLSHVLLEAKNQRQADSQSLVLQNYVHLCGLSYN